MDKYYKTIVVLSTQEGDWEAIYIGGKIDTQGHSVDNYRHWWNLGIKYGSDYRLIFKGLNDEDNEDVQLRGDFPLSIYDLKGDYSQGD